MLRVYTDGSYARGFAGWGWIAVRGSEVVARRSGPVVTETSDPAWVGCNFASNNAGEVSAVVHAAEWLAARPANEPRAIIPDSWWAIAVTKGRWVARYHRAAARRASCAAAASRAELGWIKGHSDHVWNEAADKAANEGRGIAAEGRRHQPACDRANPEGSGNGQHGLRM